MNILLSVFLFLGTSVSFSNEYSMGAPDSACIRMQPGHTFDPQTSEPPVMLTLEKDQVAPGGSIRLKLEGLGGGSFKGFIIQARQVGNEDNQVGSFETEQASYMTCGRGIHNSLTHQSSADKQTVEALWKAPQDFEGEVVFRYSAVVAYDKYWVRMETPQVRVTRSAPQETQTTEATQSPAFDDGIQFPGEDQATETSSISFTNFDAGLEDTSQRSESGSSKASLFPTTATTTTTTTTTTPPILTTESSSLESDNPIFIGCGSSKSCFGIPQDCINTGGCQAVVSYEPSGTDWLFKVIGKSDGYIAVGLSSDERMGDDLTTACYYDQGLGEIQIQSGVNNGYSNEVLTPPQFAIHDFKGSYEDGYISCEYKRPSTIEVTKLGRTLDLGKDKFVIFLAEGGFGSGQIFKHRSKDKSAEPQALGIVSNLEAHSKLFIKLHGSFMIGAWILSASIGIILARYFKQTWLGSKCCKVDQWFIWHRFCMLTTWGLTIAGFILIFLELDGWTEIPISDNPHAVLGCITTGLCFMQPLIALLRCHPEHKQRPIFNWIHWFIGNAAQLVGIVAIFFAVELDKAQLPKETDYLLAAFVAFHFLMHVILSILMCTSDMRKEKQGYSAYPMRSLNGKGYPDFDEVKRDAPGGGVRKFFLVIYILVDCVLATALILLVVYAPIRPTLEDLGVLRAQ